VLQHCCDVLRNVMLARAFPERFGALVVMIQGAVCDFFQISLFQIHLDMAVHAWSCRLRVSPLLSKPITRG